MVVLGGRLLDVRVGGVANLFQRQGPTVGLCHNPTVVLGAGAYFHERGTPVVGWNFFDMMVGVVAGGDGDTRAAGAGVCKTLTPKP